MKILEWRSQWATIIFSFCVPLGFGMTKWGSIVIVAGALIEIYNRWKNKGKGPTFSYYLLLPVLCFLAYSLSAIYSTEAVWPYLERRLSFVIFPLYAFLSAKSFHDKNKIYASYIVGCIVAIGICFSNAIYNSLNWTEEGLIFDASVAGGIDFIFSISHRGNYFFSSHLSQILMHPIFLTIYLTLGVVILIDKLATGGNGKKKGLIIGLLTLFSGTIFLLSSRTGMMLYLIVLVMGLIHLGVKAKISKKIKFALGVGILLLLLGGVYSNPRIKATASGIFTNEVNMEMALKNTLSSRYLTWKAGVNLIKQNPVLGVGVADCTKELVALYKQEGYEEPLRRKLNTHNQFLQTYLATGIFGLIILIFLFSKMLFEAIRRKDYILLSFSFIFIIGNMTDTLLDGINGIIFFVFFYIVLLSTKRHQKEIESEDYNYNRSKTTVC